MLGYININNLIGACAKACELVIHFGVFTRLTPNQAGTSQGKYTYEIARAKVISAVAVSER